MPEIFLSPGQTNGNLTLLQFKVEQRDPALYLVASQGICSLGVVLETGFIVEDPIKSNK